MRIVILLTLLIALTSFCPPPPDNAGIKLTYKILKDGKQIGEINAARRASGVQMLYEVQMEMDVKVLFSQKLSYSSQAVYSNDVLQKSISKSYLNDKLHHICITTKKGDKYEIRRDKDVSNLNRLISYGGVMLYFREPGQVNLIYSEMAGHDNLMTKTAEGQYTLTDSKSKKKNKYWYKGGILDRAIINHTLFDFEVRRVN